MRDHRGKQSGKRGQPAMMETFVGAFYLGGGNIQQFKTTAITRNYQYEIRA
jgi:hypothetical protein